MHRHLRRHKPPSFRRGTLIFFALALFFFGACGTISNDRFFEGLGHLHGTLLLPSGEPARFAHIEVVNLPQLTAKTDAQGDFLLSSIPAGKRDILFRLGEEFGLRLQLWIVRDHTLSLDTPQRTLLPSAILEGTIQAAPRFGAKNIQIALKGTSLSTLTLDTQGTFRMRGIPPLLPNNTTACHSLSIQTAAFHPSRLDDICPQPGQIIRLDQPIRLQPQRACFAQSCAHDEICEAGFCVPDNGGSLKLLTPSLQFPTIVYAGEQRQERELLQNTGLGPLLIESISLQDPEHTFSLEGLPSLPLRLAPQESLRAIVRFSVDSKIPMFGRYQAKINISARHEGQGKLFSIPLSGMVIGQNAPLSQCVQTKITEPTTPPPQPGTPSGLYDVDLTNTCDQEVVLSDITGTSPVQALLAADQTQRWLTSLQHLPLRLASGATARVQFQWMPGHYGTFQGEALLRFQKADQSDTFVAKFSLRAELRTPNVILPHDVVSLGHLGPSDTRYAFLPITLSEAKRSLTHAQVDILTAFGGRATQFRTYPPVPRLEQQSHQHILTFVYTAPSLQGRDEAWLLLRGISGLGGYPYAVQLQAQITQQPLPQIAPRQYIAATRACASPETPLLLSNPTDSPLTLRQISLPNAPTNDFVLRLPTLPLTLQPKESRTVAWVRFTPPSLGNLQAFRSFASLQLDGFDAQRSPFSLQSTLQASSGLPALRTYPMRKLQDAHVVVYIDPSIETFAASLDLKQRLIELFSQLKQDGVTLRFYRASLEAPQALTSHEQLWLTDRDVRSQGLASLSKTLSSLRDADIQSLGVARPALALVVSARDDASTFSIQRYLPTAQDDPPWLLFSAIPSQTCSPQLSSATRYIESTHAGSGLAFDLCAMLQPRGLLVLNAWIAEIKAAFLGQRTRFHLDQTPDISTLSLKYAETLLTQNLQWSFDPTLAQISLSSVLPLHPEHPSLEASYFTPCAPLP